MKDLDSITEMKKVKANEENYWLIKLMYGSREAWDSTAYFYIPSNISFNAKPN